MNIVLISQTTKIARIGFGGCPGQRFSPQISQTNTDLYYLDIITNEHEFACGVTRMTSFKKITYLCKYGIQFHNYKE